MTLIRSSVVTINGVYAGNFLKLCIRNPMLDSAILTSARHAILFFISFAWRELLICHYLTLLDSAHTQLP